KQRLSRTLRKSSYSPTAPGFVQSKVTRLFIPVTDTRERGLSRAGMRASATSSTDVLFADSVQWEKRRCFLVTFCHRTKSYPLLGAEALALKHQHQKHSHWIPAFAGMTIKRQS